MTESRAGFVLDTGALIALESPVKARRLAALLDQVGQDGRLVVSAGCVAEAWRGSGRQAPLALLLRRAATETVDITVPVAKSIGVLLGRRPDGDDIVDAHVVMLARHRGLVVVSSDPADLHALDSRLIVHRI